MAEKTGNGTQMFTANHVRKRPPRHHKQKPQPQSALMQKLIDNQLRISSLVLGTLLLASLTGVPNASSFHALSYRRSQDGLYDKGLRDACFIASWFVQFTLLRVCMMDYVLRPLGRRCGIRRDSKLSRFSEQGWNVVCYLVSWIAGLRVMYGKPYDFFEPYRGVPPEQQRSVGTAGFWIGYPHSAIGALDKCYYLIQIAFWLQQIFVIHTEKRRKDYCQMLTHHIVTLLLITSSYMANFTYIGNAVLVLMDVVDIVLSLAKTLRYVGFSKLCDILFAIFVAIWIYTRHYLYFFLVRSIMYEGPQLVPFKYDPANGHYWTFWSHKFFLWLFAVLQVLLIIWLGMIFKVIVKVVRGSNAEDTRSDSEDSEEEEAQKKAR